MVTTKRMTFESNVDSGIDVLEKNTPKTYEEYMGANNLERQETLEEARERMHKNLYKLLNHENYTEIAEDKVEEKTVVENVTSSNDEDIRPTSTTMQFGSDDVDQMYKELNKAENEDKESYKLNAKGKVIIALYSLAVTFILALIILNTGIIASLTKSNAEREILLSSKMNEYSTISDQIESVSSNEYVSGVAESEFGMVKK